jgi:DNA-binding transcriptional regulator YiaG
MATFATSLRMEIRRLASKDIARALRPVRRMRRQLQALRLVSRGQQITIGKLERRLVSIQGRVRLQGRGFGRLASRRRHLIQPLEIHSIRKRLGLSRLKFAKLVGVSPGSIFGWEHGRTQPRGDSVKRLRELEKRGAPTEKARKAASKGSRRPAVRKRQRSKSRRR